MFIACFVTIRNSLNHLSRPDKQVKNQDIKTSVCQIYGRHTTADRQTVRQLLEIDNQK